MSTQSVYVCDTCGKRCDNHYAEKGWIALEGIQSISEAKGVYKKASGSYQTRFRAFPGCRANFCSRKCMTACFPRMDGESFPRAKP